MDSEKIVHRLEGLDIIILAVIVVFFGMYLTERVKFLKRYSIPPSVVGGILCSLFVAVIGQYTNHVIEFDMKIRDLLLLIFFTTVGLSARLPLLAAGGKSFAIMTTVAAVFLVIQNSTGVLLAFLFGIEPAYGLFAGSISLAGGHGTAIAWGDIAAEAGLDRARELGMAIATFGLICGGLVGGPVAQWLINRNKLSPEPSTASSAADDNAAGAAKPLSRTLHSILGTLLILAVCVQLGALVNRHLLERDFLVPGFLTAMFVGIFIVNLSDVFKIKLEEKEISDWNEISLQLFLGMSLMSMDLTSLFAAASSIMFVLLIQISVITAFAVVVIYRLMGRNYDAAVMCGGFCGMGLGATPVAIANMNSITAKHGPSPKAFLVIPLVGAFFMDICNALVIQFFVGLPALQ
jgi:ESS family glutamate:Na+ symporter